MIMRDAGDQARTDTMIMSEADSNQIAGRLATVRNRIAAAARRAHRAPASVRLVLASKTQPAAAIAAAYAAGARDFGENYVQEAVSKRAGLAAQHDIRWHLIGHLQGNKARAAVATFEPDPDAR